MQEKDIEQIKSIIGTMSQRYVAKGGDLQLAGIDGDTVKIKPSGFCWR